jgi:hypothetical protein
MTERGGIFSSSKHSDQVYGPHCFFLSGYWRLSSQQQGSQGVHLIGSAHLVVRLRMSGGIFLYSPIFLHGMVLN